MDHNRGVKRSKKENNKLMLDSLQWHYDPLSREFWHQKQRVYTLSLDCYDEKKLNELLPTKGTQIFSTLLPHCLLISPVQKANHIAAESCIVTESPKGLSPSCLLTH